MLRAGRHGVSSGRGRVERSWRVEVEASASERFRRVIAECVCVCAVLSAVVGTCAVYSVLMVAGRNHNRPLKQLIARLVFCGSLRL